MCGGVVGEVKQYCYLWNVWGGTAEGAIRAKVGVAWRKWREISSLLVTIFYVNIFWNTFWYSTASAWKGIRGLH